MYVYNCVCVYVYICTDDGIRKGTTRTNLDFGKGRPQNIAVGNLGTYTLYYNLRDSSARILFILCFHHKVYRKYQYIFVVETVSKVLDSHYTSYITTSTV